MLQERQRGRVVKALDLQFGGPEFKSCPDRQLDLFSVVTNLNPRPRLSVNGQLVCFRPLRILDPVMLDSAYLFQEFVGPLALVL